MANHRDPSLEGAARRARTARWFYQDGKSGISPGTIAELLGVSTRSVQRYLGRDGTVHGPRSKEAMKRIRARTRARRQERDKVIERVRAEYRQGLPVSQIAHRAGIHKRTVYRFLGSTPRRIKAPEPEPEPPTLPGEVRAHYEVGRSLRRIAEDARIPVATAQQALRESLRRTRRRKGLYGKRERSVSGLEDEARVLAGLPDPTRRSVRLFGARTTSVRRLI